MSKFNLCEDCRWHLRGARVRWWSRRREPARCTNPEISPAARVASGTTVDVSALVKCADERRYRTYEVRTSVFSREFTMSPCGADGLLWEDGFNHLPAEMRPGMRAWRENCNRIYGELAEERQDGQKETLDLDAVLLRIRFDRCGVCLGVERVDWLTVQVRAQEQRPDSCDVRLMNRLNSPGRLFTDADIYRRDEAALFWGYFSADGACTALERVDEGDVQTPDGKEPDPA